MTCKLIINKHKNTCAGVYSNEVNFPDSKLPGWSNDWRHMTQSEVTSDYFIFFCTSLHVWMYGATTSNSCFNFMHQPKNLRIQRNDSVIHNIQSSLRVLVVSWNLPQQHQNFLNCLIYVVWSIVQGPPWLMWHYESQKNAGHQSIPNMEIFNLDLYKETQVCSSFQPTA